MFLAAVQFAQLYTKVGCELELHSRMRRFKDLTGDDSDFELARCAVLHLLSKLLDKSQTVHYAWIVERRLSSHSQWARWHFPQALADVRQLLQSGQFYWNDQIVLRGWEQEIITAQCESDQEHLFGCYIIWHCKFASDESSSTPTYYSILIRELASDLARLFPCMRDAAQYLCAVAEKSKPETVPNSNAMCSSPDNAVQAETGFQANSGMPEVEMPASHAEQAKVLATNASESTSLASREDSSCDNSTGGTLDPDLPSGFHPEPFIGKRSALKMALARVFPGYEPGRGMLKALIDHGYIWMPRSSPYAQCVRCYFQTEQVLQRVMGEASR
jgi:hypothetical protein